MYIPEHFRCTDGDAVFDLLDETQFGVLINGEDATHLPFIVLDRDPGRLFAHFAKPNPHSIHIGSEQLATLVVQGPHCYISPNQYEHQHTVPTWNFLAVHLKGKLLSIGEEKLVPLLKKQVEVYEGDGGWSFDKLGDEYFARVSQGVTGFIFEIHSFEAKFKLSQNKRRSDQEKVIASLCKGSGDEPRVSRWMEKVALGSRFTKPEGR